MGCQATSYTCKEERGNGGKITLDELNSSTVINQLNNGNNIFCKDIYPYINDGLPFFNGIVKYNIQTENPSEISSTSAIIRGAVFCTGLEIIKRGFNIRSVQTGEDSTLYTFNNEEFIDNLKPNQKYIYYFFAELSNGEIIKGEEIEFSTEKIKSEIFTLKADNITHESAIINGAIVLDRTETLLEIGVEYSTPSRNIENLRVELGKQELPYFHLELKNLKPKSNYRYRVYANLDKGSIYGDYKTFKTTDNTSISDIKSDHNSTVEINSYGIIC